MSTMRIPNPIETLRCFNFWIIYSTDGREYVKSTLPIGGSTDHGFALHIYFLFDGSFGDRKITVDCQFRIHDDVVQFTTEISSTHSTNYSVFACAVSFISLGPNWLQFGKVYQCNTLITIYKWNWHFMSNRMWFIFAADQNICFILYAIQKFWVRTLTCRTKDNSSLLKTSIAPARVMLIAKSVNITTKKRKVVMGWLECLEIYLYVNPFICSHFPLVINLL